MKKFILFSFLLFLSCFNPFAPKLDQQSITTAYVSDPQTPEEVLQNFVYAYNYKDSLVYAEQLDSSFVFVYFDPYLDTSGRFVSWNRDVDLKTTGRLFHNFDTITLQFNHTIYEFSDENSAELSKTLNLNLFGKSGDFSFTGIAIFNFSKNKHTNVWKITRWRDESQM